jgi:ATP/ADP translocase
MIGLYNFINATGEYIISKVILNQSIQASEQARAAAEPLSEVQARPGEGLPAVSPTLPRQTESKAIHSAFMDYQLLTNLIALVIQLFLVSRIFKWVGVGGALLFLPLLALGGYALISFGAVLVLVRWVKAFENGTDYSLQNTTKAALFLVTKREEKYKAKAAIDTFFVRGGDTVSALAVLVGAELLRLRVELFAVLNVVVVVALLLLCFRIIAAYKRRKAAAEAPTAPAGAQEAAAGS